MAQYGSTTNVTFRVVDMLTQAILRTGTPSSALSAEMIQTALREFNLWLSGMSNRGTNLWCQESFVIGMRIGQTKFIMPAGTIDIKDANNRRYNRLTGSGIPSSSEGNAAFAFDGDVTTVCQQATPGGNIAYNFGSNVRPTMFGYLTSIAADLNLTLQYNDGVTWQDYFTSGAFTLTAGQWVYFELDSTVSASQWRVVGDASLDPLTPDEVVWADTCTDIPLFRMNRDDYSMQPNKGQLSRVLQYWFNNRQDQQEVVPWPLSNTDFECIQGFRIRQISMVNLPTEQLDVPQRWLDCMTWVLAYRLLVNSPSQLFGTSTYGDMNRLQLIKSEMDAALEQVEGEERDNSEINLFPDFSGYTSYGRR